MRSERLVVLLSKKEKARIAGLAAGARVSMGEFVRGALLSPSSATARDRDRDSGLGANREYSAREERTGYAPGEAATEERLAARLPAPDLAAEQAEALERLADVALRTMARANTALDRAFDEIAATRAYFEGKRTDPNVPANPNPRPTAETGG